MIDLQTVADRVEIDALRGEFTDAVMRDYDRLASLFTHDVGMIRGDAVLHAELPLERATS